jgi:aspartyl-tRNA(Asn)/glutamyl-tRNA(Gln) amidotransferase subunit C
MKITEQKVDDLAKLSRLKFDENEKKSIQNELEKILEMCEKLQEVNTDGVEPLIYMTESHTVLRSDEVIQEISKAEALKNAPKTDGDFFRVPKVIDQQ